MDNRSSACGRGGGIFMNCPKCNVPTKEIYTSKGVYLDACEKCRGRLARPGGDLLFHQESEMAPLPPGEASAAPPKRRRTRCPRCNGKLVEGGLLARELRVDPHSAPARACGSTTRNCNSSTNWLQSQVAIRARSRPRGRRAPSAGAPRAAAPASPNSSSVDVGAGRSLAGCCSWRRSWPGRIFDAPLELSVGIAVLSSC